MRGSISCVIIKAKPIDTVFSTPHFQTHCGLAVLNLQKGYDPPFAKTRVSFTTSNTSDAENRRPAALPYAGCTPYSTGIETQPPQSSSHRTTQAPCLAPRRPRVAVSTPGGGTTRPARTEAGSGPTGPSLAERKENDPARKAVASADGEYASVRLPIKHMVSPKTSSGERCEKQAGERPGVAGGVPCRVTSPGRAGR